MRERGRIRSPQDIGDVIRDRRGHHGLSQADLAESLGVSQRYLSELERGRPKVFDERYIEILSKLGIGLLYEERND